MSTIMWKDYKNRNTGEFVKAVILTEKNRDELVDYIAKSISSEYTSFVMPVASTYSPEMPGGIVISKAAAKEATIITMGDYIVEEEDGSILWYEILDFKKEFFQVMHEKKAKEVPQFHQEIPQKTTSSTSNFSNSPEKEMVDYLVANMPKPQTRQPMFNRREIVAMELWKASIANNEKLGLSSPDVFLDYADAFLTESALRDHREED